MGTDVFAGGVMTLALLALYLLPTWVAVGRGHHHTGSIAVINMLLGWTFVGFVVALAMACSHVRHAEEVPHA